MSKILSRICIPARLMDEMLLKEAAAFDVPASEEGLAFLQQWPTFSSSKQDALMKTAYQRGVSIIEANKLGEEQ